MVLTVGSSSDRFGLETSLEMSNISLSESAQERVLLYVALLRKWQPAQNLVGPGTMTDVWLRHVADSLQLIEFIDHSMRSAGLSHISGYDLGSGAGLPGAIIALATADREDGPAFRMTLIEANTRKASFLRTVSRETGVPITVEAVRIEQAAERLPAPDFITARALAPLQKLVNLANPWMQEGATAFFHKGGEYERELAEWPDAGIHDVVENTSVIDAASRVLCIRRHDVHRGAL